MKIFFKKFITQFIVTFVLIMCIGLIFTPNNLKIVSAALISFGTSLGTTMGELLVKRKFK